MKKWLKRLSATVIAILLAVNTALVCFAEAEDDTATAADNQTVLSETSLSAINYKTYSASHSSAKTGDTDIVLSPLLDGYITDTMQDKAGIVLSEDQREITYGAFVEADTVYGIEIEYYAMPGRMKDIEFSLKIDGVIPFDESESISVSRVYADDGKIERDQFGNDIRPSQKEVYRYNTEVLTNKDGYYDGSLEFYFRDAAEHTVTLCYYEGSMIISDIRLVPVKEIVSYSEYGKNASEADKTLTVVEAETSYEKSSSMLYPTYDRSSAATSPSHYSRRSPQQPGSLY